MDDGMSAFTRTSRKRFGGGGYSDDEDDYRKPTVPVRVDSHYSSGQEPPPRPAAPAPPPKPFSSALDDRDARIQSNPRLEHAPATEIQVPPPDYSVAASSITNTLYTTTNNNTNHNLLNNSSSQMSRGGSEDLSPLPGAYRASNNSNNSNNYHSGSESTEPMSASVTSADVVAGQSLNEDAIRLRIEQEAARLAAEHQQQRQQQQQENMMQGNNNSGKSKGGLVMSRRTLYIVLAAIILLLVAVAVALGVVFGLQSGGGNNNNNNESNSPADNFPTPAGTVTEPPTSCPYCYGGFPPTLSSSDFNRQSFDALGDTYTCGTFQDSLNALGPDDEACPLGQAFTWKYCGCPLIPETNPRPTQCTLCENGQAPPGQQCANEAAFVDLVGSWRPNQCPNLKSQGLENCSCGGGQGTTPAPTPAPTPARTNTPAPVGGGATQPTLGTGQTGSSGYGLTWQFVSRDCGGYTPTLEISCGEGAVLQVVNATNRLSTTNFNCGAPFDNTLSCTSDYDPNVVDGTAAWATIVFLCIGNQQSHWQATATSGPHVGVSCSGTDNLAAHVLSLIFFDFVASQFLRDATCQSDAETTDGACFSRNSCTANPGQTCPAGVSDVRVTQNSPLPADAILIQSGRRDLVVGTTTMTISAADTLVLPNLRGGEPLVLP